MHMRGTVSILAALAVASVLGGASAVRAQDTLESIVTFQLTGSFTVVDAQGNRRIQKTRQGAVDLVRSVLDGAGRGGNGRLVMRRDSSDDQFEELRTVVIVGDDEIDPGGSAPSESLGLISGDLLDAIASSAQGSQLLPKTATVQQITAQTIGSLVDDGFQTQLVGLQTDNFRLQSQRGGTSLFVRSGSSADLVGSIRLYTSPIPASQPVGIAETTIRISAEKVVR